MRPKTLILFVVAIGCGLIASIGVSQYMEKAKGSSAGVVETAKIYVATTEISQGERLDAKNVRLAEWPKDRIPEGAVSDLKELEDKFPRTRFYKGAPILVSNLSGTDSNLGQTIPQGFGVVAVKVDESTTGGGLIRPGDRVDLVVFLRKSAEVPETGTRTILRDVNVFAVSGETERHTDKQGVAREVRTVSLLVTPRQAEVVTLAKEVGVLSLTLRRPGDPIEDVGDGQNLKSLLGSDAEVANDKKTKLPEGAEAGLAQWLSNNAATVAMANPPQPVAAPTPPPKFVMIIRTPNQDRKYHFQELNSQPEEIIEDDALTASPALPVPANPVSNSIPNGQKTKSSVDQGTNLIDQEDESDPAPEPDFTSEDEGEPSLEPGT